MQHDLSQRNQTTERTVGVRVGNDREMGGGGEHNLKKGGVRIQQGLHKIEGLTFLCQLCKETFPFKKTILFQDFPYIYFRQTYFFVYTPSNGYFHKANKTTTKHKIDATEKSVENVNNKILF